MKAYATWTPSKKISYAPELIYEINILVQKKIATDDKKEHWKIINRDKLIKHWQEAKEVGKDVLTKLTKR